MTGKPLRKRPKPKLTAPQKPMFTKTTTTPTCREHNTAMRFNPERVLWECTTAACWVTSSPKLEEGAPTVGKGDITAVIITDQAGSDHMYLRAEGNNVMIPVGAVTRSLKSGTGKDGNEYLVAGLTLTSVQRVTVI